MRFALLFLFTIGCGDDDRTNTEGIAGDGGLLADASWPDASPLLQSDFTPPAGAAEGPAENGPWNARLLLATSDDGLTFTRKNEILSDQADVPDAVVDSQGWIYLYHLAWSQGRTCVAISPDGGASWAFKFLQLSGFDGGSTAVDPDISLLPDGTFRLFLTWDPEDGDGPRTYFAEGTDGISFVNRGIAFQIPGVAVLDPSTIQIGSTWHYFAGGGPGGQNWYATSSDGTTFAAETPIFFLNGDGAPLVVANGIAAGDGVYRIYTFPYDQAAGSAIYSLWTTSGESWTLDEGQRLSMDPASTLESQVIKDPAVTRLPDGRFLMVYVSVIPE